MRALSLLRLSPLRIAWRAPSRGWLYPLRLVEAPRVLVDVADGGRVALRGVVCSVCAARTQRALEGVVGVESVDVDLARSEARLRYAPGVLPDEAALQDALDRVVVGMGVRRWIEDAAQHWRLRRSGT